MDRVLITNRVDIAFPFGTDVDGRVSTTPYDRHVEQLIEQVLFTNPGERVNRPDFGCGLLRTVFEPIRSEFLDSTEVTVRAALLRWLSDVIHVVDVQIAQTESKLQVSVAYSELGTSIVSVATIMVPGQR